PLKAPAHIPSTMIDRVTVCLRSRRSAIAPAGRVKADRRDRKHTVTLSIIVEGMCAGAFLMMALHGSPPLWGLLAVAAVFGAARAVLAPASQAFLPMVVGRKA